ncbi:MAG: DUF4363 family protein [Clostridia bacterium]|nr:DUF4363 family protein [Clostridia bacterium]
MKAFIFAGLSILILILIVVVNGIYVSSVSKELEELSTELSFDDKNGLEELESYWRKNETIVCLSISHNDIDNLNIAIDVLKSKQKNGEDSGFYEYKAMLLNYIEEIRNKERVHIHNIL